MAWLLAGGAALCLAPCAGALVLWGLVAFHELRERASGLGHARTGRRASTVLFDEFLVEQEKAEQEPCPAVAVAVPLTRRAFPTLLYEHLEERQPRMLPPAHRAPVIATGRGAGAIRLVPLTV